VQKRYLTPFCVLLLAIAINQSAVHWRRNVVDSDLFAYFGWCVADGARPYLDIWDNKPPGIWWVNAAAIGLAGPGARADVVLGAAALAVTLAAFVGVARLAFHRSLLVPAAIAGAIVLTHLHFECGSNRTETLVVACETLAMLGYLHWLRGGHWPWLVLAGVAAGAAPLFKQSGLAAAAAIVLHLAWRYRGWKQWLIFGAALALPGILAMAVLAWQGALRDAIFAVLVFNRTYFAIGDATWVHVGRTLKVLWPVASPLAGVLALVALGLLGGVVVRATRGRGRLRARPGVGLFVLWCVAALYFASVGPGRRSHHLMPALPALALLTLYPLHLLVARHGLRKSLARRPSVVCALVIWAGVLGVYALDHLSEASRCWQTKAHWYGLERAAPNECEQQGAALLRLTRPGDTIYVWGWSPGTYRYACRRPASRFATLEKCGQLGHYADFIRDGAIDDIQHQPPAAFVASLGDYAQLPAREIGDWLRARYQLVETVAGMHILTRRSDLDNVPVPG
jgi:4-amino-4-deoxy-L-arabinose transferase-like glycosyltransferase